MSKDKNKSELYKNGKAPWRHLLAFPICIILWFASIVIGVYADEALYRNSEEVAGHPVAVFTIFIPMVLLFVFAVVLLIAVIRYIKEIVANKKWRENK